MDELKYIDIGGGLTVDYGFDHDSASPRLKTEIPKFSEYARRLREAVPYLFENTKLVVFTEFGRSVSANSGFVFSEVEYVKETGANALSHFLFYTNIILWKGGRKMAVIHCGADMFVRSAYLPQIWKHRITVLNKDGKAKSAAEDQLQEWDIVGPLCFSGDIVAHQRKLPNIVSGDYIIIHDAGAYTLGMWSRYNSRQVPFLSIPFLLLSGSNGLLPVSVSNWLFSTIEWSLGR
jgi:diaminopimelate decarboxylase